MDAHGLSRWCYLSSITLITLGLSFEGIFSSLLLEEYLHEKSLEESRCITFNLSLVVQREKCVVCEKSRAPTFPCYEHSVFYVLNSAPLRKPRKSRTSIPSNHTVSHSTAPPTPSLRTTKLPAEIGLMRNKNVAKRGIPSASGGHPRNVLVVASDAVPRHPTGLKLTHAADVFNRRYTAMEQRVLHDTRKRIAVHLNVSRKYVHGPVFLYESHYTWTRLNEMRERERDRSNFHPNCAKVECNAEFELNEEAIERYVQSYKPKSLQIEPFMCFAGEGADDGGEHAAFMKTTISDALIVHLLLWPAVCFVVGLLALIANLAFMGCDVWHD